MSCFIHFGCLSSDLMVCSFFCSFPTFPFSGLSFCLFSLLGRQNDRLSASCLTTGFIFVLFFTAIVIVIPLYWQWVMQKFCSAGTIPVQVRLEGFYALYPNENLPKTKLSPWQIKTLLHSSRTTFIKIHIKILINISVEYAHNHIFATIKWADVLFCRASCSAENYRSIVQDGKYV